MTERTYTRAEVDAEVASAKQLQHEVTLEAAAKKGHMAAFNFLGMDKTQRAYSWHDVEDALTEGSAAIRALSTRPDLLARHDAELKAQFAVWDRYAPKG